MGRPEDADGLPALGWNAPPNLDDTALLLRHARDHSDGVAMERAFSRVQPHLEKWIATRMGPALRSKLERDDIVQDCLLAAWKALPTLVIRDRDSFLAWLFRLAENRVRDAAKGVGAQCRAPTREAAFDGAAAAGQDARAASRLPSPSVGAAADEEHERVLAALASLRDDHREVLRLVRLEGLAIAEAAHLLGLTTNAVNIRLFRATAALAQALGDR